jgi:hypothetical protein
MSQRGGGQKDASRPEDSNSSLSIDPGILPHMPTSTSVDDFWSRAPELFQLANEIQDRLESSELSDPVIQLVGRLADAIPGTPDPLSDMDPYLRSALLTSLMGHFGQQRMGIGELSGLRSNAPGRRFVI